MDNNLEKKESKIMFFSLLGVLTLITAIAGATYAYFSATATNNNVIKGESAYDANALKLEVNQVSAGEGKLVPQLNSAIQKAVEGASGKGSCIDANGNTICKVYTITVTNKTSTKFYVTGTLSLVAANMPNLKWATGTSATAGFDGTSTTTVHPKAYTSLVSNVELAGGASKSYFIVVWISETGAAQADSGNFTGTVTFNGYSTSGTTVSGITSTIRS